MDNRVGALLDAVGVPREIGAGTEIVGNDPVLASRFPIGECAAVALGAGAAIAARLWEEAGGDSQTVTVDVARAAASLISYQLLRCDGQPAFPGTSTDAGRRLNPALVMLYEGSDGRWIHLNGGLPHHADLTLSVLGCDGDRDSLVSTIKQRPAFAWEDDLAAAGTCGGAVRTAEEWAAHPQGQALAPLGAVQVDKIGDSEPEPVGDGQRPLGGVRVIELARMLAGPANGLVLASHGAEVLLVNSPNLPNFDTFVMDTSHGKRSAWLDIDNPDEAARLRELAASADVFAQGYRGGALDRHGFGAEELAALRPGIVYVTINCYGDVGPWRQRPGWEQMAQSVTGLVAGHSSPEQPAILPAAATDYTTGYLAALGTIAALWRRAHEGGSYHVRASLSQTGMWIHKAGAGCDISTATGVGDGSQWMVTEASPFGSVQHLRPAVDMSLTSPCWDRPTVPLGHDPASWAALSQ